MKNKRQEKILDIIRENVILTQDELQNALLSYGFNVTQSTVSRDIKELKLIKDRDSNGNYRYISAGRQISNEQPATNYHAIISSSVRAVDYSLNDVVIKCYNGMASSACVALDSMFEDMMLGSIAGDDTVFVVTHTSDEAQMLASEIKKMILR